MLALPHSLDELDFFINPEVDYWSQLYPMIEQKEGWSFVLKDYENWKTTWADFWFCVAVVKETKEPICCMLVALDEASANGEEPLVSGGFYYTDPEWRSSGVGFHLSTKARDKCIGKLNMAMGSILPLLPKYILFFEGYHIRPYIYHYGQVYLKDVVPPVKQKGGLIAKKLGEVNWNDVVAYDVSIRTRKREKYLRKLLEPSEGVFARIILDKSNKVVGFGSIRAEISGCLAVGPLYADSKEAARIIIDSVIPFIDKTKHTYLYFVYPGIINSGTESLMREISDGKFETAPYAQPHFSRHIIPIAEEKVFSVTEAALSYV